MEKTKFWDRVLTFFWWNVMAFGWFVAIFNNKIYNAQETWLINYSKKYKK
jgi:hypothetical protein